MPKLTEAAILKRDAKRDLAAELRESLAQLKRGEVGRVWRVSEATATARCVNPSLPKPAFR